MANGKISTAMSKGTVVVADLVLQSVLCIPTFHYNLLSVRKLTRHLNCTIIFSSSRCEFQDPSSGKMIASYKEKKWMYYLVGVDSKLIGVISLSVESTNNFLLWHNSLDIQVLVI